MEFTLERFGNELFIVLKTLTYNQKEIEGTMACQMSYNEISELTGCSKQNIISSLQDLEQFGYITVHHLNQKPAYEVTNLGAETVKLMLRSNFIAKVDTK